MENTLILAGDRGHGKAFKDFCKKGLLLAVIGLVFAFGGGLLGALETASSWGRQRDINTVFTAIVIVAGGLLIAAGIAAPFLAMYEAKRCYIDLYEGFISGARVIRQAGQVDKYEAFQIPYDKVTGVGAQKNKVFLYIGATPFECHAFNADEICKEIQARMPR